MTSGTICTAKNDGIESKIEPKRLPAIDFQLKKGVGETRTDARKLMDTVAIVLTDPKKSKMPLPLHYREGFELMTCMQGERVAENFCGLFRLMSTHAQLHSMNEIVDRFLPGVLEELNIDEKEFSEMQRYMLWKIQDPAYVHVIIHSHDKYKMPKKSDLQTSKADYELWKKMLDGKQQYRYPETLLEEPAKKANTAAA